MSGWYRSDEFEMPLDVFDLDGDIYSVSHRRLCVWFDELDGVWRWEIETYDHKGFAAAGAAASEHDAKTAAEAAARCTASVHGEGGRQ